MPLVAFNSPEGKLLTRNFKDTSSVVPIKWVAGKVPALPVVDQPVNAAPELSCGSPGTAIVYVQTCTGICLVDDQSRLGGWDQCFLRRLSYVAEILWSSYSIPTRRKHPALMCQYLRSAPGKCCNQPISMPRKVYFFHLKVFLSFIISTKLSIAAVEKRGMYSKADVNSYPEQFRSECSGKWKDLRIDRVTGVLGISLINSSFLLLATSSSVLSESNTVPPSPRMYFLT